MRFYTTVKLGPRRERTPEGFLLCKEVPVGRTGIQIYGPGECPVEVGPDGVTKIHRDAEEVFRPETLESCNGKPLVDDHPEGDVTPANWNELARGTMMDARRGKGAEDDLLLADILVTNSEAIRLITEEGKEELSLGYDADYEELGPGEGRQVNIIVNHVALVDNGRCGSRCSIRDSVIPTGGRMKNTIKITGWQGVKDRIAAAFRSKDEAELNKVLDSVATQDGESEGTGEGQHIHIHANHEGSSTDDEDHEDRLAALEAAHEELKGRVADCEARLATHDSESEEEEEKEAQAAQDADEEEYEEEAPEGTGDKARKAKDSAYFADSVQQTVATAEILAPGITIPTIDQADAPKKTLDSLNTFRKKALAIAASTPAGATVITELRGGKVLTTDTLDRLSVKDTRVLFNGTGAALKQRNAAAIVTPLAKTNDSAPSNVVRTAADFNRIQAEFWGKK